MEDLEHQIRIGVANGLTAALQNISRNVRDLSPLPSTSTVRVLPPTRGLAGIQTAHTPGVQQILNQAPASVRSTVSRLFDASLSASSHAAYQRSWSAFVRYSRSQFPSEPVMSISPTRMISFIAHLLQMKRATSTIVLHVTAVSRECRLLGLPDVSKFPVVEIVLKGLRNLQPSRDLRVPVTPSILLSLMRAVDLHREWSVYDRRLFSCIMSMSFYGLFRMGELVGNHRIHFSSLKKEGLGHYVIMIKEFKHNATQTHHYVHLHAVPSTSCPVLQLDRFLEVRGSRAGPLFIFSSGKPVSQAFFNRELQKLKLLVGMGQLQIQGHSFRIGGATHAFRQGKSELQIQRMGRWHSNSFHRYIRPYLE